MFWQYFLASLLADVILLVVFAVVAIIVVKKLTPTVNNLKDTVQSVVDKVENAIGSITEIKDKVESFLGKFPFLSADVAEVVVVDTDTKKATQTKKLRTKKLSVESETKKEA